MNFLAQKRNRLAEAAGWTFVVCVALLGIILAFAGCQGDENEPLPPVENTRGKPPTIDAGADLGHWHGGPPDCPQPEGASFTFLTCPGWDGLAFCQLQDPAAGHFWTPNCRIQGRRCVDNCPPPPPDGGVQ
jgi:hypothetical protein